MTVKKEVCELCFATSAVSFTLTISSHLCTLAPIITVSPYNHTPVQGSEVKYQSASLET